MIPLHVRADLAGGVAHGTPWGIALDGLLASQLWGQVKTGRPAGAAPAMDMACPPDLDLPLAKCRLGCGDDDDSDEWHWAATCSWPVQPSAGPELRHWTGRVDHRHLEQVSTTLPKVISNRQGRYRARRMPLLVTSCVAVTWTAVGDLDAVRDLVSGISAIGKKRASGEGQVLSWSVSAADDMDRFTAGHLTPDGDLGRPAPAACLTSCIGHGGNGLAGLRPPYMHPGRQRLLCLPGAGAA